MSSMRHVTPTPHWLHPCHLASKTSHTLAAHDLGGHSLSFSSPAPLQSSAGRGARGSSLQPPASLLSSSLPSSLPAPNSISRVDNSPAQIPLSSWHFYQGVRHLQPSPSGLQSQASPAPAPRPACSLCHPPLVSPLVVQASRRAVVLNASLPPIGRL